MVTLSIINTKCVHCGKQHEIELDLKDLEAWQAGQRIQVVMPYLSPNERELLISGTCSTCWDNIFSEE
jgi:hypothetical protein